jgi:hypothetical protein
MNEGTCLIIDIDESRLHRRIQDRYLDELADNLDDAIERVVRYKSEKKAISVGLAGNAATIFAELLKRDVPIDIVTDQTSAHDPLYYIPEGISVEESRAYAERSPEEFTERAEASMAKHVEAMVGFMAKGAEVFDYGNSIRDEARKGGYSNAFKFPGFIPAYIRPLFCEGKGPFRWVALSGDKKDIYRTDQAILELFPDVQFYDYTKVFKRIQLAKKYSNYDLTFSFSGNNIAESLLALEQEIRVAVVFEEVPAQYWGVQVVDGDAYDMRYQDPGKVVIGLKYKKVRNKIDLSKMCSDYKKPMGVDLNYSFYMILPNGKYIESARGVIYENAPIDITLTPNAPTTMRVAFALPKVIENLNPIIVVRDDTGATSKEYFFYLNW